ncbi:MAG TPA: hypothetical protein VJR89_40510, partial [Polyangiales bacterium]|nr:hypothetical protein [Polyangiales bacterium]
PAPLRAATRPVQHPLPAPQPPAASAPQPSAPEAAPTPLEAARAFALGDDARALERYAALARAYPERSVYSVIAGVLARRTQER